MKKLLKDLLAIPSPTFHEKTKTDFIVGLIQKHCPQATVNVLNNNIIADFSINPALPTLALIGHSDVVPEHFEPYLDGTKLHGAGASDMQAALAVFLDILFTHHASLSYNIKLIVYAREEGTALPDNGLNELLQRYPETMQNIDCAIVGEPTDNTVQLGCLGSLHALATVQGKAAHSARPWNGENALYKALPLIQKLAQQQPQDIKIHDLSYKEVMQITEARIPDGRTTIPDAFYCNINYRFGPDKSSSQAFDVLKALIEECGIPNTDLSLVDSVPAGRIIKSKFCDSLIAKLERPIEAKQAWTDVAQLAEASIPCFNFGPGQQAQAHHPNEYVDLDACTLYHHLLTRLLTT